MERIHLEILQVVQKSPNPPGWYNIAIVLGMKGIIPKEKLTILIGELLEEGYIVCDRESGTHGTYSLTEKGRHYLEMNR